MSDATHKTPLNTNHRGNEGTLNSILLGWVDLWTALGSNKNTKSPLISNGAQNKGAGSIMYLNSTASASLQITALEGGRKKKEGIATVLTIAFRPLALTYPAFSTILNIRRFAIERLKGIPSWERRGVGSKTSIETPSS